MQVVEAAVDPRAYDHLTFLPAHSEVPSVPSVTVDSERRRCVGLSQRSMLTSSLGNCPTGEQPQAGGFASRVRIVFTAVCSLLFRLAGAPFLHS